MNERQKKAYDLAEENYDLCQVCKFRYDCHGVQNYGDGPVFPPCADGEPEQFVDFEKLDEYAGEQDEGGSEDACFHSRGNR